MKPLYVFGNKYLPQDNFALAVAQRLQNKYDIHFCTAPDDLLEAADEQIIILDVVKGIHKTIIIRDIAQIKTRNILTGHDVDVGFFLTLLHEIGRAKKIVIVGIPQQGDAEKISQEVADVMSGI